MTSIIAASWHDASSQEVACRATDDFRLAGREICLDLAERLLITVARKLEPTGNRSSRHDCPPEMSGVERPLVRAGGRISSLLTRYPKEAEPGATAKDGWQRQKSRSQPLSYLAVCERHSNVTGRVAGANAHQYAALLVGARSLQRGANVTGFHDVFSGDL